MFVSSLTPEVTDRARFSDVGRNDMPKKSGCYVLTTSNDTIVYIGESGNMYERIGRHISDGVKTGATPWGSAYWVYYTLDPTTEDERKELEDDWLEQHKRREGKSPYFND